MTDAPEFPPFTGFSWDEPKRQANLVKHGVDFSAVADLDFSTCIVRIDNRFDYGEIREVVFGFIGARLHVLIYARRLPLLQVVSLRKANDRERDVYDDAQKT